MSIGILMSFFKYISTQDDILDTMSSPLLDGERPYVLIVRGDGFPCGYRPWVQLDIGPANHGQEARTLAYNWTIDVALTTELYVQFFQRLWRQSKVL